MRDNPVRRLRRANPCPRTLPAPEFALLRDRIIEAPTGPDSSLTARGGQRPGSVSRAARTLPIVVSGLIAIGVAAAVLLLVHRGHPAQVQPPTIAHSGGLPPVPATSPKNLPALRLINKYQQPTIMSAICRPGRLRPLRSQPDREKPPPVILHSFGVLRESAKDRPRRPATVGALMGRVFVRYVRIARRIDHVTYTVFPTLDTRPQTSARCAQAAYDAVKTKVDRAPARLRVRILRLAYERLLDVRYERAHPESVCIFSNGGGGCGPLLYVKAQGEITSGGSGAVPGSSWSYLVPDGVASITAHYSRQRHNQGYRHPVPAATVTAKVIHNVAEWRLAVQAGDDFPNQIVWRAKDGKIIRTVYGS